MKNPIIDYDKLDRIADRIETFLDEELETENYAQSRLRKLVAEKIDQAYEKEYENQGEGLTGTLFDLSFVGLGIIFSHDPIGRSLVEYGINNDKRKELTQKELFLLWQKAKPILDHATIPDLQKILFLAYKEKFYEICTYLLNLQTKSHIGKRVWDPENNTFKKLS